MWEDGEKRKGGGKQLPPINRKNNPVFDNHLIEK